MSQALISKSKLSFAQWRQGGARRRRSCTSHPRWRQKANRPRTTKFRLATMESAAATARFETFKLFATLITAGHFSDFTWALWLKKWEPLVLPFEVVIYFWKPLVLLFKVMVLLFKVMVLLFKTWFYLSDFRFWFWDFETFWLKSQGLTVEKFSKLGIWDQKSER